MSPDEAFKKELLNSLAHLQRFAMARTGNREVAEEVVNDTVIEALNRRDNYTQGTNMKSWLFSIMVGVHNNMRRRQKRADDFAKSMASLQLNAVIESDPIMPIMLKEAGDVIESLPVEQKSALYLMVDGYSYEEIGKILDCGVGAVKSRVLRARQAIADVLELERPKGGQLKV